MLKVLDTVEREREREREREHSLEANKTAKNIAVSFSCPFIEKKKTYRKDKKVFSMCLFCA